MQTNMYAALIDYFKKGIVASDYSLKRDFAEINKIAVLRGYLISPDCCNAYVESWLESLTENYNATFYKEWSDVIDKSRFELCIDQIRHYASTYGKIGDGEAIEGNGFVPNDGSIIPRFEDLKVIEPISEKELAVMCFNVLKTGVALKDSTMKVMCDCCWNAMLRLNDGEKPVADLLSEIKNKEAVCYISKISGVLPADEFGILRCIAYEYTGRMELIKSKATIAAIKAKTEDASFRSPLLNLTDAQIARLSRIFLRFKPIFLAMKGRDRKTCRVVNRLRRLAVKNHKPFKIGFWESIVKNERPMSDVEKRLEDLDNFRKIRLMMLCKERMNFKTVSGVFTIRNGKQYVRENYSPKYDVNWIGRLYFAIEKSLCDSLGKKACKVRLPEGYDIALPTSEKNFVGNVPYGTSIEFTNNNVVGVYWRNEWKTFDYDLSYADLYGNRIAWNSSFYNGGVGGRGSSDSSVIYSGDMTNANPEAVELLYMKNSAPDGMVMINKFNGCNQSKFRFFFANECLDGASMRNHMVDPNNIRFDTMIDFDGQGQKTIGLVLDNRFYLMDMTTGRGRVSSGRFAGIIIDAMKKKAKSFIGLKEILYRAGFEVVAKGDESVPEIDFTDLKKDTLIDLLAD